MRTDTPPLVPLLILGGSDRRSTALPEDGRDKHVLSGFKALRIRVGGRPLLAVLIERLRACHAFGPFFLAGPGAVYEDFCEQNDVHLIDTDGSFGENLRSGLAGAHAAAPGLPVALATADILPDSQELDAAVADYRRRAPLEFWFPQCRIPEDPQSLGQSAWKPKYRIRPTGQEDACATLPGHLLIVRPDAIRIDIACRIFDLAYRSRNRSVTHRRLVITRGVLGALLREDITQLLRLRLPTVTYTVLRHGLALAREILSGVPRQEKLEGYLRFMFFDKDYRRNHPYSGGSLPILDALSLARDMDTVEEAREIADGIEDDPVGADLPTTSSPRNTVRPSSSGRLNP